MQVIKKKLNGNVLIELEENEALVSLQSDNMVGAYIPIPENLNDIVPLAYQAICQLAYLLQNDDTLIYKLAMAYQRRIRSKIASTSNLLLENDNEET